MKVTAAILGLALGSTASSHRLDEYLQATIFSLHKDSVRATMLLMPGTAVFSRVIVRIDKNGDGTITDAEGRAYGESVLRDLLLSVDGKRLKPRLCSFKFPEIGEMKKGQGNIELKFEAAVSDGSESRKLIFENRHQKAIGAYLVNCLVPNDPALRVGSQFRNYTQSRYELDYVQSAMPVGTG
ncbi:hypothetical protein EON82_06400 [bacterium]|nr:MAG: hypothetical protein EON82_06400 [bacterium]